ncbi:hypothetical protein EJB05_07353, partial [Eragrostis curvula]
MNDMHVSSVASSQPSPSRSLHPSSSHVVNLQAELTYLQAHLATLELPSPPPLPAPPQMPMPPAPFSISDLPSATNIPTTVDLSALFDAPPQAQWAVQHQQHHHHQQHQHQQHQLRQPATSYGGASVRGGGPGMAESSGGGGGDLQALARELLDRHRSGVKLESPPPPPHSR